MSDLIRKSDVIKALEECHLDKQLFEKDVFDKIDAMPTAYDVDKVVEDIKSLSGYGIYKNTFESIIEIVRKGGVE